MLFSGVLWAESSGRMRTVFPPSAYGWVMAGNTLRRPRQGRMIGGVCAGIADRFGLSPFLVRLIFVVSCVLPGPQILIYLALWILIPNEP
jgi:phage shock protein PspC (stress-responsive transcriptional regulator)